MSNSRIQNTTRNTFWGFLEKIILMVLPFITRTLILKFIGEKYLGLNGLFTSIISVLNLTDLGFSSAITYTMYKPIAENDNDTLCAILNYYKKIYRIIGSVVLIIGLVLMPFLPQLIKDEIPSNINIYVLFAIYLTNTVLSYLLFAYKKSLLHAYHRDDMITKIAVSLHLVQYGLQIFVLFAFDSYYMYVIVLPLITLLSNIATAIITKKMYPNVVCRGKIDPQLTRMIKKQVSGAFISKVCGVTRNSLDSMFISSFLGLTQVAIYSNYAYILNAVHNFMNVITNSMIGGVGNSVVKENLEKNYKDFTKFTFLYSWISGWFACCMLCLYQPFMYIWTGKELMLPFSTMTLFCIYLYVMSINDIRNVYFIARGLWWEGRWRYILETVANFILHFIGAKYFGLAGILLATILTMFLINFLYGTSILYKHYFTNAKMFKYLLRHLVYFGVTLIVCAVTYSVCSLLPSMGIINLLIKAVICTILPNLLFLLAYNKTQVFADIMPLFKNIFSSTIRKFHR